MGLRGRNVETCQGKSTITTAVEVAVAALADDFQGNENYVPSNLPRGVMWAGGCVWNCMQSSGVKGDVIVKLLLPLLLLLYLVGDGRTDKLDALVENWISRFIGKQVSNVRSYAHWQRRERQVPYGSRSCNLRYFWSHWLEYIHENRLLTMCDFVDPVVWTSW